MTRVSPNAKSVEKTTPPQLPIGVPIYGPRFVPPSYLSIQKRKSATDIKPSASYIRPLTIVHPFYFPELGKCPQCDSVDITWEGWNPYGHRDVHGVSYEETVLGMQLECKSCRRQSTLEKKMTHRFTTTNVIFWERRSLWEQPRELEIIVLDFPNLPVS